MHYDKASDMWNDTPMTWH